ncbi:MAG TPA: ParB/RepB/Spo0J family partition protein, partial [Clostridia bacterium]|nr:ParB/RepB/Spo0J family partition protein [Clostridia bacterium]
MKKETNNGKPETVVREGRVYAPWSAVRPDPNQPRKNFDQAKLQELADSIKEQGVIQDIIVEEKPPVLRLLEPDLVCKEWRVQRIESGEIEMSGEEGPCRLYAGMIDLAGYFQIVDGERRWRAAELAGLEEVPIAVRKVDEKFRLAMQVVANQQRENLTALEEAAAYKKAIDDKLHTAESLYKTLGISRGTLFSRLALNRLYEPVRKA